jgi:hypothetical protein
VKSAHGRCGLLFEGTRASGPGKIGAARAPVGFYDRNPRKFHTRPPARSTQHSKSRAERRVRRRQCDAAARCAALSRTVTRGSCRNNTPWLFAREQRSQPRACSPSQSRPLHSYLRCLSFFLLRRPVRPPVSPEPLHAQLRGVQAAATSCAAAARLAHHLKPRRVAQQLRRCL